MKRKVPAAICIILIMVSTLAGCGGGEKIDPSNPVTLNLWHNYGGQLKETMDNMIDEFNESIGIEKGIIINVTSISGSATLHEKLTMAAHKDPGAPKLPDITTAYPKTALILANKGLLTDLNSQFSKEELSAYIPEFIEEGHINGESLYVFPTAKSTEVLFVNTTLFNRFARDTGAKIEDLQSFEGIARTACLYYEWTDGQTPDLAHDGKMFYMPDSLFNFSLIACKQLGTEMINDGNYYFSTPQYKRIWDFYHESAVLGRFAAFEGYATDLSKTGDIVCSTGSTAGLSFFSPTVTYADNTSEAIELAILPYPVFEGGKKVAIQRGAGMCVIKSTPEKEYAAAVFLKWFTSPENNLRFVSSTGYLPVTKEAFGEIMSQKIDKVSDERIKKLLQTARIMQQEYEFYIPPLFDGIDEMQKKYESQLGEVTVDSRTSLEHLPDSDKNSAYQTLAPAAFDDFI
jgi:multiple sugar transport system substrate-binding protein